MSSIFSPPEWRSYVRERLLTIRIIGLVGVLWALAMPAAVQPTLWDAVRTLTLLGLLVAQFRLWDDLHDLPSDRRRHPTRTLSLLHRTDRYTMLALIASMPIVGLIAAGSAAVVHLLSYVGLAGMVALTYRLFDDKLTGNGTGAWLLWLKYPGFMLVVAEDLHHPPVWFGALCAFAIVAINDTLDTRRKPRRNAEAGPNRDHFETIDCPGCSSTRSRFLTTAEDDLTGKPGLFTFVTCSDCSLSYQSPRLKQSAIGAYYDDEYIAHRKKTDWGWLTPLYRRAMDKHDRAKFNLIRRYVRLDENSMAIDVGCGAGSFAAKLRRETTCLVSAVDFKDMSGQPWLRDVRFHHGLFGQLHRQQAFASQRFGLITMWHFLEHDYEPQRSLRAAGDLLAQDGVLVIEVPRLDSLSRRLFADRWPGLQAPQHTVLFSWKSLQAMVRDAGLEVVDHLPYGAFPAYFYLFAGAAFKLLRGRGLDLDRAIVPYFVGQALLSPLLLFERRLNLAMQTVVCRRPARPAR